jgi:hypothetical protein
LSGKYIKGTTADNARLSYSLVLQDIAVNSQLEATKNILSWLEKKMV